MKKFLYAFFLIFSLIGLSSCNSDSREDPPPPPTEIPSEEKLIGTWEIYFFQKDLILNGRLYEGSRDPENDGFHTKFYKEGSTYKYISYNAIGMVTDLGLYEIKEDHLLNFYVKECVPPNGTELKDSVFTTIQDITGFSTSEGIMYLVAKYDADAGGRTFGVEDLKKYRNKETAPNVHPGVDKINVKFDDYLGTWQIHGYEIKIDGKYDQKESDKWFSEAKDTKYRLYYDQDGYKRCDYDGYDADGNPYPMHGLHVVIIDDVMHFLFNNTENPDAPRIDGLVWWVTDRTPYTDPDTGKQTEVITDNDTYRDKDDPTHFYEVKRWYKKL